MEVVRLAEEEEEKEEIKAAPKEVVTIRKTRLIARILGVIAALVLIVIGAEFVLLMVLGSAWDKGAWEILLFLDALVFMIIGASFYAGGGVTSRRRIFGLPARSEAEQTAEDMRSQLQQGRGGIGLFCLIIGIVFFVLSLIYLSVP